MSIIAPALLELLADPETHEPLSLASEEELAKLRHAVQAGRASRGGGSQQLETQIEGALLPPHKRVAYLIEDGIPNLLIDERLELAEAL